MGGPFKMLLIYRSSSKNNTIIHPLPLSHFMVTGVLESNCDSLDFFFNQMNTSGCAKYSSMFASKTVTLLIISSMLDQTRLESLVITCFKALYLYEV